MTSNLRTPTKANQPTTMNRSLPVTSMKSTQLALTTSTPTARASGGNTSVTSPLLGSGTPRNAATSLSPYGSTGSGQLVRRRTPFPIVNQNEKGVFEKIVDVLIGDGPGDRFAMICKECYAHNGEFSLTFRMVNNVVIRSWWSLLGMASKEDFEYTTFRCAFCNVLNPARKAKPAAPRLSVLPKAQAAAADSSSDEKEDSGESNELFSVQIEVL